MTNSKLVITMVLICATLGACGGDGTDSASLVSPAKTPVATGVAPRPQAPTEARSESTPPSPRRQDMMLTQFVDPFIGTGMNPDSRHAGNVSPGATVPFGMVNFGPNTPRSDFNGSGGYLSSRWGANGTIHFFSVTHLSGVGCPGQGTVAMLPSDTAKAIAPTGRPAGTEYDYSDEAAEPGYYKVRLGNGIVTELTATARVGMARITYANKDRGFFSIDARLNAGSNASATRITPDRVTLTLGSDGRSISGQAVAPAFCTPYGTPWNAPVYFYANFDKPLRKQADTSLVNTVVKGAATLQFDLSDTDRTVTMKVAVSSVSIENARRNLLGEGEKPSFDDARANASALWNDRLNTVQIDQAANPSELDPQQRANLTKFYTALYRVFGAPTLYSDTNGEFRSMRQPKGADGRYPKQVDQTGLVPQRATARLADYAFRRHDGSQGGAGNHYTGFSMWDTYRSQVQLLAMLAPKESSDMMQSLVTDGLQCGAFPHWVDGSDDSTPMRGDNALNVMAAAYKFGATDFDLISAARLTKQSVFDTASACNDRPSDTYLSDFIHLRYVPQSKDEHSSSTTIERVLSDRSAAAFLQALPASVLSAAGSGVTPEQIRTLYARASWWRNIFDETSKTIAARNAPPDGAVPGTLGTLTRGGFHESTEPNYFWSFAQDWSAVIDAIGGKQAAVSRLDALFSITAPFSSSPDSKALNGNESSHTLYIGNEPAFQSPWAYNWAGQPSGAQYVIPIIMSKAFTTKRNGLPGNDDMGAMSSWYVWAALGMFPVIPSEAGLALSTPQFSGITVWFVKGRKLRIESDRQVAMDDSGRPAFAYIRSLKLDGADYAGSWLPLGAIDKGATLRYQLSATPTQWAAADKLRPPSGPDADYTRMTAADALPKAPGSGS